MRRWITVVAALVLAVAVASGGYAQTPAGSGDKMEKDKMEKMDKKGDAMMDKKDGKKMDKKGDKTMDTKDGKMSDKKDDKTMDKK